MSKPSQPYIWPNYQRELLLKAILFKGDNSINAWREWQQQVDFRQLDITSRQMIPLLYRNLTAQQIVDPLLDQYKVLYQHNWAKNHKLFQNTLPLLTALHNAGIETWLLKGAALSVLCYKDPGVRVMADCDVLVSQQHALAAMDILRQLGWEYGFNANQTFNQQYFAIRHSDGFGHAALKCNIDLHWRVFSECGEQDVLDFKQNSIPLNFFNVATRTLNLSGHLFHVCVHGANENVGKKLQWATDAMTIINAGEDVIDWQYIIYLAKKFHLSLPLYDTLHYLYERLYAPIPQNFLQELNQLPVKNIIRNEYYYKTHPRAMSFLGAVSRSWHQHSRLTGFRGIWYRLTTYPGYLQVTWGARSLWRLPVAGFLTVMRRFIIRKTSKKP